MQDVQVVFFDLYNTLVFNPAKSSPYGRFFSAIGIDDQEKLREAKQIVLTEDLKTFNAIAKRLGVKRIRNIRPISVELNREISQVKVYADALPVLAELKRRGLRLCLISNLATPYKKPVFDSGLDRFFDQLVFSCDVGCRKPDQAIFQIGLEEMGIEPHQGLMVGDSYFNDYRAAKDVGLNALLLSRRVIRDDVDSIGSLEDLLPIFFE